MPIDPGNVIGPGKVIRLKSATIVQIDPLRGGLIQAFVLLRSTIAVPGRVRFDVTRQQSHGTRIRPTRNPIQRGGTVTDHSIVEPDVVRLTGTITDTPLGLGAFQTIFSPLTGKSRAVDEYRKLEEIAKARELIFLATSIKYYEDLLITELQITKTVDSGRSIEIQVDLEQQQIVGPELGGATTPALDSILGSSGSTDTVAGGTQVAEAFG